MAVANGIREDELLTMRWIGVTDGEATAVKNPTGSVEPPRHRSDALRPLRNRRVLSHPQAERMVGNLCRSVVCTFGVMDATTSHRSPMVHVTSSQKMGFLCQ